MIIKSGLKANSAIHAKKWIFFLLVILSAQSCEKWIDPDININPNEPADVTMEALLPFIEADVAFRMAGGPDIISVQGIWLQQLDGIDLQSLGI